MELIGHALADGPAASTDAYGDVPLGVECAWTAGPFIEREMTGHENDVDPCQEHS